LELTAHVYDDVPDQLIGDALRIGQILTNLLTNAVKFTAKGGIQIRLMLESDGEGPQIFRFTVSDSGIGIPEEMQALIFEAFAQGDEGISRAYGGTGLGLSICKRLAHAMNGEVGLQASSDAGSVFYLLLELEESIAPENRLRNVFQGIKAAVLPSPQSLHHTHRSLLGRLGYMGIDCRPLETFDQETPDFLVGLEQPPDTPLYPEQPLLLLVQHEEPPGFPKGNRQMHALIAPSSLDSLSRAIRQMVDSETQISIRDYPDSNLDGQLQDVRILVTDDNELNRKLSCQILENQGAEVITANSGEEAVAFMQAHSVHLILMDLHMPGCDGLEASRRIRALEAESGLPRTPIIALTADAMSNLAGEIAPAGIDALVVKPFRLDTLLSFVNKHRTPIKQLQSPPKNEISSYQKSLFSEFLEQLDPVLEEVRGYVNSENFPALWQALHRFRGSIAVVGVTSLETIVTTMSRAAKAEQAEALPDLLLQLEKQVAKLIEKASEPES
jgi:two-component system sensor histidine kinase BarA